MPNYEVMLKNTETVVFQFRYIIKAATEKAAEEEAFNRYSTHHENLSNKSKWEKAWDEGETDSDCELESIEETEEESEDE